ncbi:hypothetical protein GCM10007242_16690 [Pigmentiphaga litoralis]|uniref:hypothetical protein n=1 Tax=Pigmentiphaga litoralis TaxID=516702 RepID=UPI0016759921|nr:hypothetical protein [Pigmentiphaga litoralis]GGX11265.1 hypothetical protein GCM10007242_16690 [Pigmentiphaga litoralis]
MNLSTARRWLIAFGLPFGLTVLIAYLWWLQQEGYVCRYREAAQQNQCTSYGFLPFLFAAADVYSATIQAIAALLVAAFTAMLLYFTHRQVRLADMQISIAAKQADLMADQSKIMDKTLMETERANKEQAETTRQLFISSNGPRLIIRKVSSTCFPTGTVDIPPMICFKVRNDGLSPATVVRHWAAFATIDGMERVYDYLIDKRVHDGIDFTSMKNAPGIEIIPGFEVDLSSTVKDATFINNPTGETIATAVVVGEITFKDKNGVTHTRGFCRRFNPGTARFAPMSDPDYEY